MSLPLVMLTGLLLVSFCFTVLWVVSVRQNNAGWVDVGWSLTVVLLVGWYAFWVDGILWRKAVYALIPALWGIRLGLHILLRLLREKREDPRYSFLRNHWGARADRNFFFFFQAQGLANMLLTAPILLLMHVPVRHLSHADVLGVLLIIGAVVGEAVADRQLARWKADPANRGKTCRRGLWAVSRHPNYFFEWLHWMGYPVLGLVLLGTSLAPWWPLTLLGPVVMLILLLQFTGIPYTEKQALKSRGEDYRAYQREVSPFIPWFPRAPERDSR